MIILDDQENIVESVCEDSNGEAVDTSSTEVACQFNRA